ncbi:early growth response protein [Penicillium argentinense]|uniref:Early growth response protein n=1 Tax=Penicillium argentinense TaxID=1131581 RepID=A0A9W9K9M0_9EURO|nr:early growth response protein [Penicillium argentinense]KAJ5098204.1 early growth response protein [Penicillium argentinense]
MLQVLTNAISNSQRPLTKLSAEPVMGREKAEIVLKDLLTTLGEEEPRLSTLGLKANSVHRMMIISTLMMSHIPGMSLFSTALRLKYKKCTATEMSYLTDKWNSVPHSRRLAVSYAAQLFGTIKNQACAHFSTPVMLFHATLTMWLYAALNIPPADMTVISERRSVVLSTLGPDDPEQFRWIESGRGCVKIPGVGNLLSSSACPRRLLDEAISLMRTLNHWGISRIYGQILSALCVE